MKDQNPLPPSSFPSEGVPQRVVLFVGGWADGQRIRVPDTARVYDVPPKNQVSGTALSVQRYERHRTRLGGDSRILDVFGWNELSFSEIIMMLVENYPTELPDDLRAHRPNMGEFLRWWQTNVLLVETQTNSREVQDVGGAICDYIWLLEAKNRQLMQERDRLKEEAAQRETDIAMDDDLRGEG